MTEVHHISGLRVNRPVEDRAVARLLATACDEPSALLMEGVPGIGKSTLWLAAAELAIDRGFRVLSARGATAESVLAYAALADLLGGIEPTVLADLPRPQRIAIDRILLRANTNSSPTDQRAISASFLSVIERLAEDSPVLIAIDDLQWIDPSSARVLAFAVRRLSAHIGVLGTLRTDADGAEASPWLQLPQPGAVRRVRLGPLSFGALHAVVADRMGRSFSRPTMLRIHEVSGGNPFYAIELARGIQDHPSTAELALPSSLTQLVRARIGSFDGDIRETLLAVASLAYPTVELVSQAIGTDANHLVESLADAEAQGVISVDGNRLRFTHPLLATGVYGATPPAQRRKLHRRLAEIVYQPELRARHLALAATTSDPETLEALDAAAESTRARGAPAAAAELLDLAIRLGGDTAQRRMRLAANHFDSGDTRRARTLLEETIDWIPAGALRAQAVSLLARVHLNDDGFIEAAHLLERALSEAGDDVALRVQLLVPLSYALVNSGQPEAGMRAIDRAVADAEELWHPGLLSLALGMRAVHRFMRGDGVDEPSLRRALELEDRQADTTLAFRPTVQHALLLAWTGQVERAHDELLAIQRGCIDRGDEGELIFLAFHIVLNAAWRGNLTEAALVAEDALVRAQQLDGQLPFFAAFTVRAMVAAYTGHEDDARHALAAAIEAGARSGSHRLAQWTIAIQGFLEVSLGNYQAALTVLQPLLSTLKAAPLSTEIIAASFVPDAVETLVQLGRPQEAQPLVDALERNGRRLDRPWMLAVGGRCRSMLRAAEGDIDGATDAIEEAMREHDRLAMPFERARTQLLLGQLRHRQGHNDLATATLSEAVAVFETLNTPLWAGRARAELARTHVSPDQTTVLTPSERRVAELSASGMTNREVAIALFVSPKTVEVNLTRIYRKLGIHSRAELGRHIPPGKE